MKQEEIRKCTKVVELFRSMMDELGDMCVVYDVRFGFIVLEYYMDGYFENNSNYDNAEDLYHHLLDKWKFCWIVDKAKVNGTEEFEDYELENEEMTRPQRSSRRGSTGGKKQMGRLLKSIKPNGDFSIVYQSVTGFYVHEIKLNELK